MLVKKYEFLMYILYVSIFAGFCDLLIAPEFYLHFCVKVFKNTKIE